MTSPLRTGSTLAGRVTILPRQGVIALGTTERYRWEMLTMDMGVTDGVLHPATGTPTAPITVVPLMSGIWRLTVMVQAPQQPLEATTFTVTIP